MKLLCNEISFGFLGVNDLGTHCSQGLLSLSAVSEVNAGTDIAEKNSIGTVSRHSTMEQPSVGPVLPHHSVFQTKVLSRFKGGKIMIYTTFSIFGMNSSNKIQLQLFLLRESRKVQPGLIEKGATRVRTGHPQHDRGLIDQRSKVLFALSHLCPHLSLLIPDYG